LTFHTCEGNYQVFVNLNRVVFRQKASFWLACSLLLLVLAGGCQPQGPVPYTGPYGSLSGKVTLDGKSVADRSMIMFTNAEGHAGSGEITAGQYNVEKIPAGTYKVAISMPGMAEDGTLPAGDPTLANGANIPSKYMSPDSSETTVTVGAEEEKEFDFAMKSGT